MGASTGPVVVVGLVTWANGAILQPETIEDGDVFRYSTRVVVGTGIAAGGLALVERVSPELARGVAFVALVTVLFTHFAGRKSPIENLATWWKG